MLAGQEIGGVFVVEKELGHGAMGTVYRAVYRKTGLRVAIKIVTPGQVDEKNMARFEREVTILKQLKHPNIVRLFAHGRYQRTPFFAMEYIEGEALDRVLERRSRFTWEDVVALGKQLCGALHHAHQLGIIHRDLKPSNVMILADGTVKLTDFGIAKDLDRTELTAANCAVGTAAYMSPEQCRGERQLTPKSDLYSMGVMFYELLTGQKPFIADTPLAMFLMHTEGEYERPSRTVMELPIWLDTLICQLLEKKPDHRPRDAAIVAEALRQVEEKVQAQKSAGVDAVKARAVDRPRKEKATDEDREAARALKAATGKKKGRLRYRPFYTKVWFQALGIGGLLVGLVGIIVSFIFLTNQPERPDTLYRQAQLKMETGSLDDMQAAKEGPIGAYLEHYGDRDNEKTQQMRAWRDEIEVADRERKLRNPTFYKFLPGEDDKGAKAMAKAAIEHEEETGNLAEARKRWQELEKLKTEPDRFLQVWGLLATRRLQEIREVERLEASLREKLRQAWTGNTEPKTDSELETLALEAVRFETFGDPGYAAERWRDLKHRREQEIEQLRKTDKYVKSRLWPLIATKKVKDLKPEGTTEELQAERVKMLDARLAEARSKGQTQTIQARFLCRELIALYDKDKDNAIALRAQHARNLLENELK